MSYPPIFETLLYPSIFIQIAKDWSNAISDSLAFNFLVIFPFLQKKTDDVTKPLKIGILCKIGEKGLNPFIHRQKLLS